MGTRCPGIGYAAGGSSRKGRVGFDNPENAIAEGVLEQLETVEIEGGNPYAIQILNLLPTSQYDPTIEQLFIDFYLSWVKIP